MSTADMLHLGREAFDRRAWTDACAHLSTADRNAPLEPEDLQRLATAAYLFMKLDVSSRAAATAYAYEHQLVNP